MKWQAELCLRLICIAVMAIVHPRSVTGGCTFQLIVALPNLVNISELGPSPSLPSWEKGAEIIHGAQFARLGEEISNTSECKLELIKVNNGQCDAPKNFNLLEQLVAIIRQLKGFHSNQCLYDIVPIVGLPCNDVTPVVVSFDLSSDELIKDSLDEIFYNFMPTKVRPAAVTLNLSRALFKFMESLNWQKLGIITETGTTYFSHMAETVYFQAKDDSSINVVTYQQLQAQANERINFVRNASKITLLSASLETTADILCSAYEENAVWPKYVWILHSYLLEDIKSIDATCSISRALENVLFIRQQIDEDSSYTNPYSIALHNAVWISVRQLFNLSIGEEQRLISHDVIEVTQVRSATEIALVDINGSDLNFLNDRIKEVAISDEFEMRFEGASIGYTVIFSIEIIIGFLFVTIMLIGYVYFRNEPEVKSTSFMLSLLIFLRKGWVLPQSPLLAISTLLSPTHTDS